MLTEVGQRPGEPDPWNTVVGPPTTQVPAVAPLPQAVARNSTGRVPVVRLGGPRAVPGPPPRRRRTRRERVLVACIVLAVLALVASATALVVTLRHRPPHALAHRQAAAPPAVTSPTTTTPLPTTVPAPTAQPATAPQGGQAGDAAAAYLPSTVTDPSTVATAVVPSLPLYASPGAAGPDGHLANPNWLGAPLTLLVTAQQGGWVQAYIPVRPNESTAWFPASDVRLTSDPAHIQVNLSNRLLVLYRNNVPVFSSPIAPGAPSSPTPTGAYFVAFIVKLTDPQDAYGPYALGTSAFSNTYYSFEGGPGQIGIHGTNQPWVIGTYASHGCIRLPNDAITALATQITPGTPVEIGP